MERPTDALADGVLIAEHLGGMPLDGDHGAPVRLVSPNQYGYMSTKHLCSIEVRTSPPAAYRPSILGLLLKPHPRARVSEQERHGFVPGWLIGPVYRAIKAPLLFFSTRRARRSS